MDCEDRRLEAPKSASLIVPSLVTKMLAPLMSRWAIPLWCRYSRPRRICRVYTRTIWWREMNARGGGSKRTAEQRGHPAVSQHQRGTGH
jgi:hypothetical protein